MVEPSKAVSFACCVQVVPLRAKAYAEPESVPWSSFAWAPANSVSPLNEIEMPKRSPAAPSAAVSFCCWLQILPLRA